MNIDRPDVEGILNGLKDFQRKTVDYVFSRLYGPNPAKRFLIADEVGLGKTLIAKGVVAKAIDHLWHDAARRIDIVYICANRDIAAQNIDRLNVTRGKEIAMASRLTLLPRHSETMHERLNFISFTPGTSFDLRSKSGIMEERALIYRMLRDGWGIQKASLRNLLQGDVGINSWWWWTERVDNAKLNNDLVEKYLNELDEQNIRPDVERLMERFPRSKENVPDADRRDRNSLVGNLRRILARCCLSALEPDLIILDEFQRFKNLLDGDDEIAQLAHDLFNHDDAKVLLLSATPYKMFTMSHETEVDDHYRDFLNTVRFLFESPEETAKFEEDLERYRRALYEIGDIGSKHLKSSKELIERKLKRIMVRTERLAVTVDRDGMVADSPLGDCRLMPEDLKAFKVTDQIGQLLNVSDPIEYWKSAPYLLNFMDKTSYEIKKKFTEQVIDGRGHVKFANILEEIPESLLPWDALRKYKKIDPLNAKLRALLGNTVEKGAWRLLWIPPSLPYYQPLTGPYTEDQLRPFTKALVFSSWQVVPKVIATLCSYEAERHVMNTMENPSLYPEMFKKRRPIIVFSYSDGELRDMRFFTLIYPCITLASEIDPVKICCELFRGGQIPRLEEVLTVIKGKIEILLRPVIDNLFKKKLNRNGEGQKADQSWYVAALALLDRRYHESAIEKWCAHENDPEDGMNWSQMLSSRQEDSESRFGDHIRRFWEYTAPEFPLGNPPQDMYDVLAKVALASPAVVSLRSFLRLYSNADMENHGDTLMASAARTALGFRVLFNNPESIVLVRSSSETEERYWEEVLDYCLNGNLQAVMDEYVHILKESLGQTDKELDEAIPKIADEISTAVSIKTVNLDFDDIRTEDRKVFSQTRSLRCRFALRFGNEKNVEDNEETRADQVRKAFNSPFKPFVLASTSVGQEGLDFHQYCHSIYHWNLPANPVDLEQREGRIHRYKGHVIRRNLAKSASLYALAERISPFGDPWEELFNRAKEKREKGQNDLVPYWIYECDQGYKIQRYVPFLPLSKDQNHLRNLKQTLAAYRMVFGQPRQEDLIAYLKSRLEKDLSLEELLMYRIDLQPS